jgi:8-oxo-dGTP pyrophosphatase MutT (NUDIX family)
MSDAPRLSYAAGGVVVGPTGQVLVVSQNGDSWSLPKGHIDPGEDAMTAAVREIQEESGITQLDLLATLGAYQRHRIGKGGIGEDRSELKEITIFLFKTSQAALRPIDPLNPEARWVPLGEVTALLTHPKDRAFFSSVQGHISKYFS